jgi:hypothetical protein
LAEGPAGPGGLAGAAGPAGPAGSWLLAKSARRNDPFFTFALAIAPPQIGWSSRCRTSGVVHAAAFCCARIRAPPRRRSRAASRSPPRADARRELWGPQRLAQHQLIRHDAEPIASGQTSCDLWLASRQAVRPCREASSSARGRRSVAAPTRQAETDDGLHRRSGSVPWSCRPSFRVLSEPREKRVAERRTPAGVEVNRCGQVRHFACRFCGRRMVRRAGSNRYNEPTANGRHVA